MKRFLSVLLVLAGLLALAAGALAAEYTYTVRFFAGNQGSFSGSSVLEMTGLKYGERVTFDPSSVSLSSEKYYIRGIRESGRDNNTVGLTSFTVTGDQDYVVAYGIRGDVVIYTVRFLDENGDVLAENEIYYGNTGDKPVVAYRYIEGYQPKYYNITGTLSSDESKNVFVFEYRNLSANAESTTVTTTTAPTGGAPASTAAPANETPETSAAPTTAPDASASPVPEEPEEILDMDLPRADYEGGPAAAAVPAPTESPAPPDAENDDGRPAGASWVKRMWQAMSAAQRLGLFLVLFLIVFILIWFFLRAREGRKVRGKG